MPNTTSHANSKLDKFEKTASSDLKEFGATLQEDVATLKNDVMELGRHVRQNNAVVINEVKKTASKQFDKAREYGKEELKKAEIMIQEKPAHAVALAFAAGLVASFLFGRR